MTGPISPDGSKTIGQVRFAISPARNPALSDKSTSTRLRRGLRVVEANNRSRSTCVIGQYLCLLSSHWDVISLLFASMTSFNFVSKWFC